MKLILCADDFGYSAAVDQAIIQLITKKRLSAASCMTLSPHWKEAAKAITPSIRDQAAIGLHLDFTHFGDAYSHPKLILLSNARLLSSKRIQASINQQLDNFEAALGTMPDYVDGHQHVHQLPQIREILLATIIKRYGKQLPWLRIARPPLSEGLKGLAIRMLGANALEKQARALGFEFSDCLLGVYSFDGDAEAYKKHLIDWLAEGLSLKSKKAAVLMCHPSTASDESDTIYKARLVENEVLNSQFLDDALKAKKISLVKVPA